jgi:HEAT repeat protein
MGNNLDMERIKADLESSKASQRKEAIRFLNADKGHQVSECVALIGERLINDQSREVRSLAANALSWNDSFFKHPETRGFFIAALQDKSEEVCLKAINALGRYQDPEICRQHLLPMLDNAASVTISNTAASNIVECNSLDEKTVARIKDFFHDNLEKGDTETRKEAVEKLGKFPTPEIIDLIASRMFRERSSTVKEAAARVLAYQIGGEAVKNHMLKAADHKLPVIQQIAVEYLGSIADREICRNILLPRLDSPENDIKQAAIAAICNRRQELDESDTTQLIRILEEHSRIEEVGDFAIRGLILLAPSDHIDLFIESLRDGSIPHFLKNDSTWYKERTPQYSFYTETAPGLIETILAYADQSQICKMLTILAERYLKSIGCFHQNIVLNVIYRFKELPQVGKIFAGFEELLLQETADKKYFAPLTAFLLLMTSGNLENKGTESSRWMQENLEPVKELFMKLLLLQDKSPLPGKWDSHEEIINRLYGDSYKKSRNQIVRYLTPWLEMQGISEAELRPRKKRGRKPKVKNADQT